MKFFVTIKQYGEGCDYTIGCGYKYKIIEAIDEKDIYNQLRDWYGSDVEFEEIYYTELSNMKNIDIQKIEQEIKNETSCNHNKVYANYILTSFPPQHPWICSICGEKGVDIESININNEYDELIKRFNKEND